MTEPRTQLDPGGATALDPGAAWRRTGLVLAIGLVALIGLFWQTSDTMISKWLSDDTFSHGILIFPICLFLIWRKRKVLATLVPQVNFLGLLATVPCLLLWFAGHLAGAAVVEQIALVSVVNTLVFTLVGWQVVRAIIFPLFYLYFMVPLGAQLVPYLQDLTAINTVRLLRLSDIPVNMDGLFIHIPEGSFEVAEACAGIRFLVTSVAIGFLGSYLFYKTLWRRVLFIALSIAVPIVANFFRAYGIVMIAYWSDFTVAVGADHITFGLIFLSIVIVCLLSLGAMFREKKDDDLVPSGRSAAFAGPLRSVSIGAILLACAATLALAAGTRAYSVYSEQRMVSDVVPTRFPVVVAAPWNLVAQPNGSWQPRIVGRDAEFFETYSNGDQQVDLYIAYYAYQRQDAEIVNQQHKFDDGKFWLRKGSGHAQAEVDRAPMTLAETQLLSYTGQRLVWSWYWVDGQFTADPYLAKFLQARAQLLGGMPAAAVIAVAADYEIKPEEAEPILSDFLRNIEPLGTKLERAARAGSPTAQRDGPKAGQAQNDGDS